MIEKVVYDYLTECEIAPVYTELPESAPNPGGNAFIVIEKRAVGNLTIFTLPRLLFSHMRQRFMKPHS